MGLFRNIYEKAKSALGVGKKAVAKVVDVVSGGRISDRENQEKFSDLKKKESTLERSILLFKKNFDKSSEDAILCINGRKSVFCQTMIPRFQRLTTSISCWMIQCRTLEEKISNLPEYDLENVRTKDDLFAVDFDEHWFSSTLRATLCPYWSYHLTQKTKVHLEDAELCLQNEKEKWKAEKLRLKKIQEYIQFISDIFEELESFYGRLLNELEYSIIMMESTIMLQQSDSFGFGDIKIDLYFVPRHHVDCLMAAEKITRIICDLTSRHYLAPPTENSPGLQMDMQYNIFVGETKKELQGLKKHLYEFPQTA